MRRDVLQMSIAAAIVFSRQRRLGLPLTVGNAPLPQPAVRLTDDTMADADAVIEELARLGVLKGVKAR